MLAYYAHQHGSGHSNYAQIFAAQSNFEMPIFTSSIFEFEASVDVIHLPQEDPDGTEVASDIIPPPDYLHYSPVGQKSIQQRSALFLNEIIKRSISLVIVDLSVEIAALCRSASIPYAYVRLPGNRNDPGHLQAFQGATFLLAYYPAELDGQEIPQWIKDKTIYTGFFTKFQTDRKRDSISQPSVKVFTGKGGNTNLISKLPEIANRFSKQKVEVFGAAYGDVYADNMSFKGIHPDPEAAMNDASVIVANCGLNLTSEILSKGKPFVSIPEDRPFGEQLDMHRFLISSNLAVDLKDNWDFEMLINSKPKNLEHFINQDAPLELLNWMSRYKYNAGSLRTSLCEFTTRHKKLKTA